MFIYLITNGEHFKIGVSKHPARRLKQLQTASALPLSLHATYPVPPKIARKLEQQLHRMFWQRRVRFRGEWFDLTQEHLTVIKEWLAGYIQAAKI